MRPYLNKEESCKTGFPSLLRHVISTTLKGEVRRSSRNSAWFRKPWYIVPAASTPHWHQTLLHLKHATRKLAIREAQNVSTFSGFCLSILLFSPRSDRELLDGLNNDRIASSNPFRVQISLLTSYRRPDDERRTNGHDYTSSIFEIKLSSPELCSSDDRQGTPMCNWHTWQHVPLSQDVLQ